MFHIGKKQYTPSVRKVILANEFERTVSSLDLFVLFFSFRKLRILCRNCEATELRMEIWIWFCFHFAVLRNYHRSNFAYVRLLLAEACGMSNSQTAT